MARMDSKAFRQSPPLKINYFKGLNLNVTPTQLADNESPDMLNMMVDEGGALVSRTGYERAFDNPLGPGKVNGLYEYRRKDGTAAFLIAHGTKLYSLVDDQPVEVYSGLNDGPVDFFTINDTCYMLDGVNYLQYDGNVVSPVVPYIPTLSVSKDPTGGGTQLEEWNLLGAGFKESFSGDGEAKDYFLSLKGLDETPLIAVVDNITLQEGPGFSVDRATGKVTFPVAPPKGTNNVVITAYKTQLGFADRIKKCTIHILFGGPNDTRVWLSGNKDLQNYIWRSGLYDATYFPENGFYKIGSDREPVTGFSKQYDFLVIEKENSKGNMQYQLNNGEPSFPIKPLNDKMGTIAPRSIQIIENNPVSLSKSGVNMLVSSNVRDERNVVHMSAHVDRKLLAEQGLKNAISADFDRKYWLAINGRVYVLDYNQKTEENPFGEWFLFDNIPASCFLEFEGHLYFGGEGMVYRFMKDEDESPYHDDGQPINAYWKSKLFSFGADHLFKNIDAVHLSLKPYKRTSASLYYISNKKTSPLIKSKRMDMFDYFIFNFNYLSFLLSSFPQPLKVRVKAKKVTYFQVLIQNNKLHEGLGLLSVSISYNFGSEVK